MFFHYLVVRGLWNDFDSMALTGFIQIQVLAVYMVMNLVLRECMAILPCDGLNVVLCGVVAAWPVYEEL